MKLVSYAKRPRFLGGVFVSRDSTCRLSPKSSTRAHLEVAPVLLFYWI